jgi:hypothetical protein
MVRDSCATISANATPSYGSFGLVSFAGRFFGLVGALALPDLIAFFISRSSSFSFAGHQPAAALSE